MAWDMMKIKKQVIQEPNFINFNYTPQEQTLSERHTPIPNKYVQVLKPLEGFSTES